MKSLTFCDPEHHFFVGMKEQCKVFCKTIVQRKKDFVDDLLGSQYLFEILKPSSLLKIVKMG